MKKINKLILKTGAIVSMPVVPVIALSATTNNQEDSNKNIQYFINSSTLLSAQYMDLIELSINFSNASSLNQKVQTFVLRFLNEHQDIWQKIQARNFGESESLDAVAKFNTYLLLIAENGASQLFTESQRRIDTLESIALTYNLNGYLRFYNSIKTDESIKLEYTNSKNETQFIIFNGISEPEYNPLSLNEKLEKIRYSVYSLSKISPILEHALYLDFIDKTLSRANENEKLSTDLEAYLKDNLFTINDKDMADGTFEQLKERYANDSEKLEKIKNAQANLNKFVLKITDDKTPEKAIEAQRFVSDDLSTYTSKINELDRALLNKIFGNINLSSLYPRGQFSESLLLDTYKTSSLAFTVTNSELVWRMTLNADDYKQKYEELKTYTDKLEDYKDNLQELNDKLNRELTNKDNQLVAKDNQNKNLTNTLVEIRKENNKLSDENTSLKNTNNTLVAENDKLKSENQKNSENIKEKESQLVESQNRLNRVNTQNQELVKANTTKNVIWIIFLIIALILAGLLGFTLIKMKKMKNQLKTK